MKLPKILILLILFSACDTDKVDPTKPENSITLNGTSFFLTTTSLLGVTIAGEGHAGFQFVQSGGSTGVNTLNIDIEYFTSKPVAGVYSFPQTGSDRYLDDWLTTYTEVNGTTINSFHLISGTMTVKDNGNSNYTITMDLTMEGGKIFKGTYKGDFFSQFNNS